MTDEYDAFGRKKDEAGLGDLGWGSSDNPQATVNPTPVSAPTPRPTPTAVATGLGAPRRNPLVYVVQVLILFGIGFGIFLAVDNSNKAGQNIRNSIDDFTKGIGGASGGGTSPSDTEDAKVPAQEKARDYFSVAGLRAGLKILAKEQPGRITNLSFRRDRIDVQVVRGGKTHIAELSADGEVPQEYSSSTATPLTDAFTYEEVNPRGMARLMRAANARLNRSKADVDYFVPDKFSGVMQWGIYYKGGSPIAQGDSRGRYLRRIS